MALFAFLAVVTSLFALFISAYFTRMELDDWTPLSEPGSLWFNTAVLVLASVAIHWCTRTLSQTIYKVTLLATGVFTLGFIWGQYVAWQQLWAAGYYLNSNPANSFFFLFTALHALHLFGGLWVWTRATFRVFSNVEVEKAKMSVELCRTYWHFLLVVWLVLFALLLST
jgi:cytochrome c oxidase subunit 3